MPFVTRARNFLNDPGPLMADNYLGMMQATVEYLLNQNAISSRQAVSTNNIIAYLNGRGYYISREGWQHHVLGPLREHGIALGFFIGTIIGGSGMFIINTQTDANVVRDSMSKRIQVETRRLRILEDLMRTQGWT